LPAHALTIRPILFLKWTKEIHSQRCRNAPNLIGSNKPGSESDPCADIKFYLVEVDFDALSDKSERSYLKKLPASFHLSPEAVDRLRAASRRILRESAEFQRLLRDLKY